MSGRAHSEPAGGGEGAEFPAGGAGAEPASGGAGAELASGGASTARDRPEVVVFDVVETLADLAPVAARLRELSQPDDLLHRWFTRILRDGLALTAAQSYAPFAEVARSALRAETFLALTDVQLDHAVGGFAELTPQPDTVAAVKAAVDAGFRVFTLSNGGVDATSGFLRRARIDDAVERVLSVDQVRAWKPNPAPYRLAVSTADVPAARVALVAVHSWDVHGAHAAGLTTGWCPRLEGQPTAVFTPADVIADDLPGVVAALAALPTRRPARP